MTRTRGRHLALEKIENSTMHAPTYDSHVQVGELDHEITRKT